MRLLVDCYCDIQPDIGDIHLSFAFRADVYEMYLRSVNSVPRRGLYLLAIYFWFFVSDKFWTVMLKTNIGLEFMIG